MITLTTLFILTWLYSCYKVHKARKIKDEWQDLFDLCISGEFSQFHLFVFYFGITLLSLTMLFLIYSYLP
jgi:hypothetical protein